MKEIYYFDTSVLIPYYRDEIGSEIIRPMVDSESNRIFISDWTIVEAYSALKISLFGQRPEAQDMEKRKNVFTEITTTLRSDVDNEKFSLLDALPQNYYQRASTLIKKYGVMKLMSMKTGDAVQIVAFEKLLRNLPTAKFVSADKRLIKVVKEINYEHIFIDPSMNKT